MISFNEKEYLDLEIDETQEDEVPIQYDIATYPSDFTLSGIFEMCNNQDITIPEFQREFVWSIRQSSLLIESFLLGLPVPPVFFYIDEENKNLVIDGQQRILTIKFFFEGFFGFENYQGKRTVFRLEGLDDKSPFSKKCFSDLDDSDQRKLKSTVLRAINIRQLAPRGENTSIYHIFERLNTGGTPLKPQEIRNVVFRGEIVRKLRELNDNEYWKKILGKNTKDKHQQDVELILRIFALSRKSREYEKPMKEYLNKTMERNKNGDTPEFLEFAQLFPQTAQLIIEKLDRKPFHLRGPLNSAVLDSVFCTLLDNLNKIPSDLVNRFASLKENVHFNSLTRSSTTDTNVVRERFKLVKSFLIGE